MVLAIWKLALASVDIQDVSLPKGAKIIHVREQGDSPCLWFLCDPAAPRETRRIGIAGTGHSPSWLARGTYLGTASLVGGQLILHVFDLSPPNGAING